MKKLSAVILLLLLLCGCSQPLKSDDCEFLTNADWVGTDEYCTNSIYFSEDGAFGFSCACGNPVGNSDVAERFIYNGKENTVTLYDCDNEKIDQGTVLYADEAYLIIDIWDGVYVFENQSSYIPKVHNSAIQYTGTETLTKPCLTVLGLSDGILTVSSYNYDGDASDMYKTWELEVSDDVRYTSVSVTVENDIATVEEIALSDKDTQNIGEIYTGGYFGFSSDGKVDSVVFYGELIIYN